MDCRQELRGALAQQVLCHRDTQGFRCIFGTLPFGAQNLTAVAAANQATQPELTRLLFKVLGEGGNRNLATALQPRTEGALGEYTLGGDMVVQRL